MINVNVIETDRLVLRHWKPEDYEPFAKMNADSRVMEFFPALLSREESDAMILRMQDSVEKVGFALWATEIKSSQEFIGFIGLSIPRFEAAFTPCVEIGWRIAAEHWGKGYAPEGAKACLNYGFETLGLRGIVSFTATQNYKSRRVMEKIGMKHNPMDDFDHPSLAEGHPLRRHVLYRIANNSCSED